jgi:hypothetical protein
VSTVKGVDVSKWQATTPPLAGLDFLFARASVGTVKDDMYAWHTLHASAAGLIVGAYHFGYTGHTSAQVAAFLDAAGDVDLYALDVEGPNAQTHLEATAFIKAVKATGKVCGLYHSDSGFFDAGQDFDWVAKWSPTPPKRHWDFWQYRGSPLDLDRYNGSRADLDKLAGRPSAPPTDTGGAMKLTNVTDLAGIATMDADGPVWNVATGAQVAAHAGTNWTVVAGCDYDSPGLPGAVPSAGYMIVANAPDHELHVVARSRVTFAATVQDCAAEIAADRAKATVAVVYE